MISFICVFLAIGSSLVGLSLAFALWHHVRLWLRKQTKHEKYPMLSIISPQRGKINPKNIDALLKQDYPGTCEIIFVTTYDDASLEQLQVYTEKNEHVRIITAGDVVELAQKHGIHRCQKNHNIITAIESASQETEVFVIVDADACPFPDWLRNLIAPFEGNPKLGAVTSARVYIPGKGLASWAQATWILFSVSFLIGPYRHIWGGGLAIPKIVFEKANLIRHLNGEGGVSITTDDMNLYVALRQQGYDTLFSPDCLVPRYPPDTKEKWSNVIRFTNRQILQTWWVSKRIWLASLLTHGIRMPAIICAVALAWWNPIGLLVITAFLTDIMSAILIKVILLNLAPKDFKIKMKFWIIFLPFVVPCLSSINLISAPFHRKMRWGGIEYSKRSVLGYTGDFSWRSHRLKGKYE